MVVLLGALCGCGHVESTSLRPVSLELKSKEGQWRLDGVGRATLELDGWNIQIVESGVFAPPSLVPILEKLVLEITNTSPDKPLVLEPEEIAIVGFGGESARLGPREQVVLKYNESVTLGYTPGIRAPELPHPFHLRVTVFRGKDFKEPQTVTLKLY